MELYLVITIVSRSRQKALEKIMRELDVPLSLSFAGQGTATQSQIERLGLTESLKFVNLCLADSQKARQLMRLSRSKLYIGFPGNGLVISIPVKSIAGSKTFSYLLNTASVQGGTPAMDYSHELIIAVANRDYVDTVMDAARAAGARGGTVVHAKGTGAHLAKKFLNVSLSTEKEIILIVASADTKSQIMEAIVRDAGPQTDAGAIAFSLPVSEVNGLREPDPIEPEESE